MSQPERQRIPDGAMAFRRGSAVRWRWGEHTAHGTIVERFDRTVSRTIKGEKVKRNGTPDCPAYLIEQEDGDRVLKLRSEFEPS